MIKRDGADLYIIQVAVSGDFKLGRSKHILKRLKQTKTYSGNHLKIILHAEGQGHLELKLHGLLNRYRKNGEWFRVGGLAELPEHLYDMLDLDKEDWWKDPQYI